jgi:hypothetical protein
LAVVCIMLSGCSLSGAPELQHHDAGSDAPFSMSGGSGGASGGTGSGAANANGGTMTGNGGNGGVPTGKGGVMAGNGAVSSTGGAPAGNGGTTPSGGGSGSGGSQPEAGTDGAAGATIVGNISAAGQPASDTAIVIDDIVYRTDAQGRFTVPDAAPAYDAFLVDQSAGVTSVSVYVGLTTRSPFFFVGPRAAGKTGSLTGTVSGGTFPNPASQRAGIACIAGGGVQAATLLGAGEGPAYGPLDLAWQGLPSIALSVVALAWTIDGQGLPSAYTGFGTRSASVPSGGSATADLALAAVGSHLLTGSIAVPTGLTISSKLFRVGGIGGFNVVNDTTHATVFQYRVPTLQSSADETFHVFADGDSGSAHTLQHVDDSVASLDVSLLPIPVQISPADGATEITLDTPFTFSAYSPGAYVVSFQDDAGTVFIDVYTVATAMKLPDLSTAGISFPKGASYSWSVSVSAPITTTDDRVSPASPYSTYGRRSDAATNSRAFVMSAK